MVKKDISVIKKMVTSLENVSVQKIASCFVKVDAHDIRIQDEVNFLSLEEEESIQYLDLFKKALTGKANDTVMQLTHKSPVLEELYKSKLNDRGMIEQVCDKVSELYRSEGDYCILFAYGEADVPGLEENTYTYLLMTIVPCSLSKPGITYEYKDNRLAQRIKETVLGTPRTAFLYPAFSDMAPDCSGTMYYTKSAKTAEEDENFVRDLLQAETALTAEGQKKMLQDIVSAAFSGSRVPYSVVRDVMTNLYDRMESSASGQEDTTVSAEELAGILKDCVGEESPDLKSLGDAVDTHRDNRVDIKNLTDKPVKIETDSAVIRMERIDLDLLQKKEINGQEYYIVPARNASIDSIPVR